MKETFIAIVLLLLGPHAMAASDPLCVDTFEAMPESWRPSADMRKTLRDDPWSAQEAADAQRAIKIGVDEMLELFEQRPAAVTELWDDAVESLIDLTYSGGTGSAAVDEAARAGALRNLEILIAPYLDRDADSMICEEFPRLLPLAIYAHRFYPAADPRTTKIVALANAASRKCPTFADIVRYNYDGMLANENLITEDVFQLVIWSIQFNEAVLVPGLKLPRQARNFSPLLWRYLESYPLLGASAYSDGAANDAFNQTGYLATHIAFIPTGYHRHPIYIQDSPKLYSFHRENFYPVLETEDLDLWAEFVDALRQYGCTEANDRQVRDGTRQLLKTFHDVNDRWMNYRMRGETGELENYFLIHKPWSATIGLRHRAPEPPLPGTYGGVVRKWLPVPAAGRESGGVATQ